ncbi:hypothetical protein [uncultured Sphingomonas sp.]|uniref:hypothetical protein n=1 Tax=uncultured Sphingomonas sp. TaxID=158754 RepID=UPI00261398A2|nr:hypothetical protein [uncultured Sphingomonas sp.]
MIALGIVALIVFALAIIATRTTISVVIRKDPDMSTIKQRLAIIEAQLFDITAAVGDIKTSFDALSHPETGAASASDLAALGTQVDAIKADIGTDANPAAGSAAAPLELTDPIPQAQ